MMTNNIRTPVREKAKEIATLLTQEQPDYDYLRELFRHLRKELSVSVPKAEKAIKKIPSQEDIEKFYEYLKTDANSKNKVMLQTLLYTGVRVSELINIKITDVNFDGCQIQIQKGVRGEKRVVFFPSLFEEALRKQVLGIAAKGGDYLFESAWNKPYTDRGIRKIMSIYSKKAGIENQVSPNTIRTFLLSWLKEQGIEDEMLLLYSGHESRYALAHYKNDESLGIDTTQQQYESVIQKLPFL
jgi:integrase/recombinase XerD